MTKPTPRKMHCSCGCENVHTENKYCVEAGCVPVEPEPSRSVQRRVAIQKGEPMPTFEPQEPGMEPALTEEIRADEQVKRMVERFLQWKLPDNFNPDGGISFKRMYNEHTSHPMKREPVGTNLFDYTQAEQMVRYMLAESQEILCPVHRHLDEIGKLEPFDNCVACIRVHRGELADEIDRAIEELPDVFARHDGSLKDKIKAWREFLSPIIDDSSRCHEILRDSLNRPMSERIKLLLERADREANLACELMKRAESAERELAQTKQEIELLKEGME